MIPPNKLHMLELSCRILCKDKRRMQVLGDVLSISSDDFSPKVRDYLSNLKSLLLDSDTYRGADCDVDLQIMNKLNLSSNRLYGALTYEIER